MKRPFALALVAGLAGLAALALYGGSARAADSPAAMQAADLRISQVYGGGGNTGAPLMCDFIEIFNAGPSTLSVNGFSVQYASSAGTTWQVTPLTGSIPAGRYFLVQEACGANGVALPAPDVTGAIAMSGTTGKVALVNSITALAGQGLGDPTVIDFVGYGTPSSCEGSPAGACTTAAPTLSNTLAALRGNDGCTDTDNNMADFTALAPSPRNSASPPKSCGGAIPTATPIATPVPTPEFLEANTSFTLADPFDCTAAGDVLNAELVFVNSGQATAFGVVLDLPLPARVVGRAGSCTASGGQNGTCTIDEDGLTWTGNVPSVPPANVVAINFDVRVAGGTTLGTEMCLGAVLNYPRVGTGPNDATLPIGTCATVDCLPTVDPNRQLGGQVHLPILDFQGQDDVCESWVEVQLLGCDPAKAVLVTWGAPGFCPPQAAGPLKVECTGLLVPGAGWMFHGAQVPTGSKSGIFFKFTARQLSEVGIDFGFDDVVADLMCEELFFGIVGDADDYRRFKKAYNEGLEFRGIPLRLAIGDGYLAVEVLRRCPGDLTPGSIVASKYNGIAGTHLGTYDPIYGGFAYYAPLVYADKGGFNTILYVQNGGLECSSVEIWFKAQDDCLRARICDIATLAPGETYQYDATSCVGPDWQGSAWIRASEPMGVVVDIVGRDVLMTYIAEPSELNFSFNPDHPYASEGNRVAFGPLIFSEYQGWDSGIQVQNQSPVFAAKVKVYFLDRSGDVITTLVDWICPRGSQTYFLPVVHDLPGNWVGSVRAESQDWWTPGTSEVHGPNIVGVAQLMRYDDAARTQTTEAIAYNLLPEHKVFDWQVGANAGGTESGVGLIAIPSLIKDLDKAGITSEIAIQNAVAKPGFTDFAIYIFDQNGLLDFVCQKLHDQQVEYIDLQTWGYVSPGFKGSAIISATYWSHEVFDGTGFFLRNLLGLAAVSVERIGTRLGEDVPGDEAAGERGIPFSQQGIDEPFVYCFAGPAVAFCPGQPGQRPVCPDKLTLAGQGGDIPDDRAGGEVFTGNIAVNFPSLPGQCVVEDVNLFLNIEHDETRDLDVALSHIDLRNDMFADICFDDEGVLVTLDDDDPDGNGPIGNTASCAGAGPVGAGDTYATMSGTGLEDFAGKDPRGQWSLIVDDDFETTFGFGRVVEWRLILDIGVAP